MNSPNPDMSQLFADRQAQRSTLHNRYLNEQFVRVLKTIGYDVGFQKGQGQYLYDRDGCALSRPAVRLWRVRDRAQSSGDARCAEKRARRRSAQSGPVRRLGAGRRARRAAVGVRSLSRQGVLRQFRHRMRRGGDQVRPRRHRPPGHRLLRPRLSRPDLWRAVADRRFEFPRRLRAAAAGLHLGPVQRSRRAREGAGLARGRGLRRRADPGQGRQHALRRLPAGRGRALQEVRHAVRRRRNPDRPGPHRPLPRGRALERRARHGAAVEVAVGRPRAGRRGADAQEHLRQDLQPDGPRGGARFDLLQERSRDGRGHRHARRDGVGEADRVRRQARRRASPRAHRAWCPATSC